MSSPVEPLSGDQSALDQLELEVRQLPGVTFVAFDQRADALAIEVAVEQGGDQADVRSAVERIAAALVEGPVVIDLLGGKVDDRPADRVRLQVLLPSPATGAVEVHLAYGHRRTSVEADGDDGVAVARAVVAGLGILGLPTPFGVVAAHLLPKELGSGTIVLLEDARTGEPRRGLARGRTAAEAAAKAALNALNRYLQPAAPAARPELSDAAAS